MKINYERCIADVREEGEQEGQVEKNKIQIYNLIKCKEIQKIYNKVYFLCY